VIQNRPALARLAAKAVGEASIRGKGGPYGPPLFFLFARTRDSQNLKNTLAVSPWFKALMVFDWS